MNKPPWRHFTSFSGIFAHSSRLNVRKQLIFTTSTERCEQTLILALYSQLHFHIQKWLLGLCSGALKFAGRSEVLLHFFKFQFYVILQLIDQNHSLLNSTHPSQSLNLPSLQYIQFWSQLNNPPSPSNRICILFQNCNLLPVLLSISA